MFRNWKIQHKLLVLVGSVFFFLCIVSVVAIFAISQIRVGVSRVAEVWLPSIIYAEGIKSSLAEYRVQEMSHVASIRMAEKAHFEELKKQVQQELEQNIEQYKTVTMDEQNKKQLNTVEQLWQEYLLVSQQVTELSMMNNRDAIMEKMNGESLELYEKLLTECKNMVEYNRLGTLQLSTQSQTEYNTALIVTIGSILAAVLISSCVAVVIIRSIVGPVKQLGAAVENLSKGKMDAVIDYHSKDELGMLSEGMRCSLKRFSVVFEDLSCLLHQLAQGDFTCQTQCEEAYVGDFYPLLMSIRQTRLQLSHVLHKINRSADQVSDGAFQVSDSAQAYSQGITQQASSVQQLAATVSEISRDIDINAQNAQQSSEQVALVGESLQESNRKMKKMVEAMTYIKTSSHEIEKIIKTIEDIAFQTNILALNAAVEAARAGAAGKGFAVVADEVRNLAGKSAEASKNTAQLIQRSILAVEKGNEFVEDTATTLTKTANSARQAMETMKQISDACSNQSLSVQQITQGIEQISAVIQNNSSTAQQSATASEQMASQANILKDMVHRFQLTQEDMFVENTAMG